MSGTEDLLKEESPRKRRKGFMTILFVKRGKLVPCTVDVRGMDAEQIALGLDDELCGEMRRRRQSKGRMYSMEEVRALLDLPSRTSRS